MDLGKLLREALLELRLELVLMSEAKSRLGVDSRRDKFKSWGGDCASDGIGDGLLTDMATEDSEFILSINIYYAYVLLPVEWLSAAVKQ